MSDRRLVVAVLTLATGVAAALRLPFLGTQSLWFDETYTVHVVQTGSLGELWDRIGASESTPPLFYLLTWGWTKLAGSDGAGAVRAVSALAIVASVPVAYASLRRLAGQRAALATAALVAVSPLLGWYALDARAYGLLVLTGLLSVWAFSASLEATTARRLLLWALAAAAVIWTHWFGGFLVLGEALALLWLRRDAWRGILLAGGAALLALTPLIGLLRDQTGDDRAAFITDTSVVDRLEQVARQFGAGINVPRTWLEAAALVIVLSALAAGTVLTAMHARRDDGARGLLALAGVGLLVPLALAATGIYDRFNVRNVLYLWPLFAALAAPALLLLRAAPLAVLLALGIATSLWTQSDWRYGNTDWRAVGERIVTRAERDEIIAVTELGAPVAELYLDRAPFDSPVGARRAWLVVEPTRSAGHRDLQPADPPVVAQLLAAFPRHEETVVHGFRVIELSAPTDVTLDPAQLPGATLLPPAG
ncbi:MAG TPA: glycosyltransferase family 39 protein [Conexibacter sp.]|nr:glycosyltransferase family 39 protein [Conexibacter sp.]